MPTLERLAKNGLTYTQSHTVARCSPTRSCAARKEWPYSPAEGYHLSKDLADRRCSSSAIRNSRHRRSRGASGPFKMALPLYVPKKQVADGTWKPPAVQRVK